MSRTERVALFAAVRRPRAACAAGWAALLLGCSVPKPDAPAIHGVEPRVAVAGQYVTLVVTGERFAAGFGVGEAPAVTIARTRDLDGNPVADPRDRAIVPGAVQGDPEALWLIVGLPADAAPGVYGVAVERASDHATAVEPEAFALVAPGVVTAVEPGAVCGVSSALAISLTGSDLLVVDGAAPTVSLTDGQPAWEPYAFTAALDAVPAGCRQLPFGGADVRLCTRLDAAVPSNAPAGVLDVVVTQPPPAQLVTPSRVPLLIDRLASLPLFSGVRAAVDAPLDLDLSLAFHVVAAAPPTVLLDDQPATFATSACADAGVPGHALCRLAVTVPQGFPPGTHTIRATSMEGCSGTTTFTLAGRPVVESISPTYTCVRDGNTRVAIHGAGFVAPTVLVGGHEVPMSRTCPPGDASSPCTDIGIYGGVAVAWSVPVGTWDLTVVNGTSPPVAATTSVPLRVAPGPAAVGGPSPIHVYAGVDSRISFPASFVTGAVHSAELVPAFTGDPVPVAVEAAPATVTITVPAGVAESPWKLVLHDDSPCAATSDGWLYTHAAWVLWETGFDEPSLYVVRDDGTTAAADHLIAGGNPGAAIAHSEPGAGPAWWFTGSWGWPGADAARIRFDLRATGDGAPLGGPGFVFLGSSFRLEYALAPAPADAWTSYLVPLDDATGWTRRDADGAEAPATLDDLRAALDGAWAGFEIRGRWTDGWGEAALDNLAVELRH